MLKERFPEHKGYVSSNNQTKTAGAHFNQRRHNVSYMQITAIEIIFKRDPHFRKQRERMYIQMFNTKYKGLKMINAG